jgi:hypothetical protein
MKSKKFIKPCRKKTKNESIIFQSKNSLGSNASYTEGDWKIDPVHQHGAD